MKSNRLKALVALYSFFLISSIVQSCCTENYKIGSTSIITAYDLQNPNEVPIDTVKSAFILKASFEAEWVSAYNSKGFSSQAYATSCATNFLNTLDSESFTLTLNKPFIFQSDTINPGTDLLNLDIINTEFNIEYGLVDITFPKALLDKSFFEQALFNFKISGKTSDGIALESDIELFLKL